MKNAHLRRSPHPSSLRRTSKYTSLLRISGALHLGIFEQPMEIDFFSILLDRRNRLLINLHEKLQDLLLAWGGGIGGHIHCILGSVKGNFLQVVFWNAVSL